ncbi:MAG TPA: response regulator [Bryobacteraceae bacterium]|nr:response regulator [Bryobacteraceae bacterium]
MIEILIVDDNRRQALLVKDCLSTVYKATVTVVENGESALLLLANEFYRPNLIVLELRIPNLDGCEVLRRIRRRIPKLPVVVFSRGNTQEDISRAYASGANMYAEKPSDLDAFRKTVQCIAQLWVAPLARMRAAHAG